MWIPPALSIIVLGGATLALIVGALALRERPDPMSTPVAVLMLATFAWALPAAIGFASPTVEMAILAEKARYPGTLLTPVAFYLLTFRYAGLDAWLQPKILAAIAIVPSISLIMVVTNDRHQWFWADVIYVEIIGGATLLVDPGPWFPIHLAWAYALMIISLVVLAREIGEVDSFNRKQPIAMFIAGAIPLGINLIFQAGRESGSAIDLTPVALGVSGAIFAIALFRLDLIQLGPIARRHVLEEIPDGVIVIDQDGIIREFNQMAISIIPALEIGQLETEIIPAATRQTNGELTANVWGVSKKYRCYREPFHDIQGRLFGELVYLRDVTAIARREQRISVLNRVLRHNIRNELTIQLGHLELLSDSENVDQEYHQKTIERSIRRVQSMADQARLVDRTLRDPGDVRPVTIDTVIAESIASATNSTPDILVETEIPQESVHVMTIDRELLVWVIAELIENALIHGEMNQQPINIKVTNSSETVSVSVIDNGPGVPDDEIEAIQSSVETALEHGSGIGLWLARWTAERSGGSLSFDKIDGRNAVSIRLPKASGIESQIVEE